MNDFDPYPGRSGAVIVWVAAGIIWTISGIGLALLVSRLMD